MALTAVLQNNGYLPDAAEGRKPVVIVGTGPVGIRTAQEILRHLPGVPVVQYGAEPWLPYNRVQLSSLLAGEVTTLDIQNELKTTGDQTVVQHHNCAVLAIDRAKSCVIDVNGCRQYYQKLVLAIGSSAHIPAIEGINKPNIFAFRNLNDAQKLLARRVRSRRTVVIGGGLLGLEAARAMQKNNTEVIVIEHSPRLMQRQLDDPAAEILREHLLQLGIKIHLKTAIKSFETLDSDHYIHLGNGRSIVCDTIVVATGIKPNVQLALDAGLHVGRGIKVNDAMQTSDPNIYAVGECAEHNGQVYGLVAPGMEQASVAAHHIAGGKVSYRGSISVTRLKVVDKNIFSVGVVGDDVDPLYHKRITYQDISKGIYRTLTLRRADVVGAIAIGAWPHAARLQEMVIHHRKLYPWQIRRFKKYGEIWTEEAAAEVASWPAKAVVCNCTGITRGEISQAIEQGNVSLEAIRQCTGASTVCGSCRPLVAQLANSPSMEVAPTGRPVTAMLAMLGLVATILLLGLPAVRPAATVQTFSLNFLWEDALWKQVSGYSVLALSVIGLIMSPRKRWKRFTLGEFKQWRVLHFALGVTVLAVLLLHTGLQLGSSLNLVLMLTFLGVAVTGSMAGAVVALESKLNPRTAKRARTLVNYVHLFMFWPLPVLLGFHIVSFYYF
ncbi:MAG TPA: FAD-dependent oxidoreductase [Gammaproteobacteria bacterium]